MLRAWRGGFRTGWGRPRKPGGLGPAVDSTPEKKEVIPWKILIEVMQRWRSRSGPQCFMRRETPLRGNPTPLMQTV